MCNWLGTKLVDSASQSISSMKSTHTCHESLCCAPPQGHVSNAMGGLGIHSNACSIATRPNSILHSINQFAYALIGRLKEMSSPGAGGDLIWHSVDWEWGIQDRDRMEVRIDR